MAKQQTITVSDGTAQATTTTSVTDSMPGVPCPGPSGYTYTGARYVPLFAEPAEWNSQTTYEPLTIVLHEGNSYTSRQFVPLGIDISNTDFWALTGNYNAQVEQYRQEVKALRNDTVRKYQSVSSMSSDSALTAGDICYVDGYYAANDYGEGFYYVDNSEGALAVALTNGLYANAILNGHTNIVRAGAKCDGSTDDSAAIQAVLSVSQTAVVPPKTVAVSAISIGTGKSIVGFGEQSVIKGIASSGSVVTIAGEHSELRNVLVTSVNAVDCVTIGGDTQAQSCTIENVTVNDSGANGIVLINSNNSVLRGISIKGCASTGFKMAPNTAANVNGNTIEINDCYGNSIGCSICGEGNRFFIVSQSNNGDNVVCPGWMNGCFVNMYTEFSVTGYELHITGNTFSNTFAGVLRTKTDKQYSNEPATYNNLLFSKTNQVVNSADPDNWGQYLPAFNTVNSKNGGYNASEPIPNVIIQAGESTLAVGQTNTPIKIDGTEEVVMPKATYFQAFTYNFPTPKTDGIVSLRFKKNGTQFDNVTILATEGDSGVKPLIKTLFNAGDKLSVDYTTYANLTPSSLKMGLVIG